MGGGGGVVYIPAVRVYVGVGLLLDGFHVDVFYFVWKSKFF